MHFTRVVLNLRILISTLWSFNTAVFAAPASHGSGSGTHFISEKLVPPVAVKSTGGELDITLDLARGTFETPCHTIITKLYQYNGASHSPGPTLVLKKGDTFKLRLNNLLPADTSEGVLNQFRLPDTTNFHTHGLHVSSRAPADDVLFTKVPGGTGQDYVFHLPSYHTPGLYWYHPHQHGSTALQVGGGAVGAIIIDSDGSDGLPDYLEQMDSELMVLGEWNLPEISKIADKSNDTIWRVEPRPSSDCSDEEFHSKAMNHFFTVNGQFEPYIELNKGQWKRLRIVNSAFMSWINLVPPEHCEFQLLAKDGIFLNQYPRAVERIILSGGGRAEVAVRCTEPGNRPLSSKGKAGDDQTFLWEGTLLSLEVSDEQPPAPTPDLTITEYNRPCYLQDLTILAEPELKKNVIKLTDTESEGLYQINGQSFDPVSPIYTSTIESAEEWTLVNVDYHSFHIHVAPFQLTEDIAESGNYFKAGDWHDTLFVPKLPDSAGNSVKVRLKPEAFPGDYVLHCHILPHEDQGMMAYARFTAPSDYQSSMCPQPVNSWPAWKIAAIAVGGIAGLTVTAVIVIPVVILVGIQVAKHLRKSRGGELKPLINKVVND